CYCLMLHSSPAASTICPDPQYEAMEKYIKDSLAAGIIRPSKSPFGVAFFFVEKKDSSLRPCIDFRGLNNITVKYKTKCKFHASQVSFLGFILKEGWVQTDPKKMKAVAEWPTPTNRKLLQRFLGFANSYQIFIHNYIQEAAPLMTLTSPSHPFTWTEEAERAFNYLKMLFTTAPVVKQPCNSWWRSMLLMSEWGQCSHRDKEQELAVPSVQHHLQRCKAVWRRTWAALEATAQRNRQSVDKHWSSAPQYSQGVLEPVGPALGKEQSFTEQAPLVADDGVQRVAGIVHNIQQFVQSPRLCHRHQRVQLRADHRAGPPDQFIQSGCVLFGYAAPPAYHSVKEDNWQPQTGGWCALSSPVYCLSIARGICKSPQPPPQLPLAGLVVVLVWTSQSQ
ncbi:hypothetical protein L3Q82_020992, partial [Scortum barcoo]